MASAGNPAHHSFVRSAIKMFQVLPFVEDGGVENFGFTPAELALCTASHGGEPFHVAAAQSMLKKASSPKTRWPAVRIRRCTRPPPKRSAPPGLTPSRIHNNCSGKHAGMLAFTSQQGWVTSGYHRAAHPTQQRMLSTVARWMQRRRQRHRTGGGWLRAADLCAAARCRGRGLRAVCRRGRRQEAGAVADLQRDDRPSGNGGRHRSSRHRPDARGARPPVCKGRRRRLLCRRHSKTANGPRPQGRRRRGPRLRAGPARRASLDRRDRLSRIRSAQPVCAAGDPQYPRRNRRQHPHTSVISDTPLDGLQEPWYALVDSHRKTTCRKNKWANRPISCKALSIC